MRSWYPIPAKSLDDKRLLAEHNELLILARTIAGIKKGWSNHPETNRWRGYSMAMWLRHEEIAEEMVRRGMKHKSPWPMEFVKEEEDGTPGLIEPLEVMWAKLEAKIVKTKNEKEERRILGNQSRKEKDASKKVVLV